MSEVVAWTKNAEAGKEETSVLGRNGEKRRKERGEGGGMSGGHGRLWLLLPFAWAQEAGPGQGAPRQSA